MVRADPGTLAWWGGVPILLSTLLCFSQKNTAFAVRSVPWTPGVSYASQWDWAHRLLKVYLWVRKSSCSPASQYCRQTTRQVTKSTGGEDFLNASMATILAVRVCVCEQLNIVGFLYLLVPFLYPVLEKTFYSFLVQKKLVLLRRSAVFNYVTPPTLCFSGHSFTHWRIYKATLCSFSAAAVTLPPHPPNLLPRKLAGSEQETVPRTMWEYLIPPTPDPQTFVGT